MNDTQTELRQYFAEVPTRERLAAEFEALSPGAQDERTATLTWYTGASVRRFDGRGPFEMRFSMDSGAVRLGRLTSGSAPLLNSHRDYTVDDVVGVIAKAWVDKGQGKATVRFSKRADVDAIWQDVQDGILRNASMGVAIHALEDVTPQGAQLRQVLVTDWEPEEVSLVPIGADPGAGFKLQRATGPQEQTMEETITQAGEQARASVETNVDAERQTAALAERTRILELDKIGRAVNLDGRLVTQHVEAGTSIEEFRRLALDELARRSAETPIRTATSVVTRDEVETRRTGIATALLHRYDPAVFPLKDDLGRDWAGLTLLDLARESLEASGTRTRRMARHDIAKLALSTSDFPNILADVANKTLRQAYEAYPRTFLPFSRRRSAADFKNINAVQLGEAPSLQKVNEKGEFTHGSIAESKETYKLATYGRIVSITRQVIINDDLSAFTRIPAGFGVAAATLESDTVWGIITSNPNMGDGVALFHANHTNLNTGGTSALALTGLGTGMAVMAKQKGLDGITVLNVQPRYVAVPVALQLTAFQLVAANLAPVQSANIVPDYIRALTPIAEPRLDASSATAWYLFASPDQIDTVEYAYLEGQDGVYIETRQGFDVDGVEIKARLDFGAKAIDWRGMQKNAGS
ncbi:prohead protease/major capsid protein fusion protein [uncultured Paludibaculum sp.]|uniref:prohead protease/major capsid protein fusion protein n=1 Tax=uncultured Paludibaculum sp. TaxID=1765020 RepID=UPI002AAB2307|nr:prohead protease/major capsid protein fusion protein [uncultured Paludibaculum sp.]